MIAIIGSPTAVLAADGRHVAAGLGVRVARALVFGGEQVEIIGRIGGDRAGDELALSLARDGIGHVALLRDAATATPTGASARGMPLDLGDAQLGLRYLTNFSGVLLIDPQEVALVESVADDAAFSGAHLVVVGGAVAGFSGAAASVAVGLTSTVAAPLFIPHPIEETPEFDATLAALLATDEGGATNE